MVTYFRSMRSIGFGLSGASFIAVTQFANVPAVDWRCIAVLLFSIPLLLVSGLLYESLADKPDAAPQGENAALLACVFGMMATFAGLVGLFWCFNRIWAGVFGAATLLSLVVFSQTIKRMAAAGYRRGSD